MAMLITIVKFCNDIYLSKGMGQRGSMGEDPVASMMGYDPSSGRRDYGGQNNFTGSSGMGGGMNFGLGGGGGIFLLYW